MCEDDLMECEFHDAEVDTAWEGASLPMLPLFATQLNASQSAQSSLGVGGGAAATFASLERPVARVVDASLERGVFEIETPARRGW